MFSNPFRRLKKARGFVAGVVTAGALGLFIQGKDSDSLFEVSKNLDIFATLFRELNTYYVDPIEPGRLVKSGLDAMLADLDPYTNYITESDAEEYEFQTTGRYGGVGASLRTESDDILVGEIYEGSPAQKAGLHPGDIILTIDNQVVKGKTIDQVSLLLKGSPGTSVSLKVKDAITGADATRVVTRGEIELSSVPYAGLVGSGKDLAFVRLAQFTPNCARQVKDALDSLKTAAGPSGLKGVVLDLRGNPGGLLDEAVNLCNLFVARGQLVVSTKGKMEEWDKDFKTSSASWDEKIPVTVLINNSSASASEIVAGTLQDLDRGVVIGERSYGKGLVQVTRPLGYNARLKLTTARYYTPSGRCIQALDYAHRSADGTAAIIPDSLKKSYKTRGGRLVKSGGGVEPDVAVKDEPVSRLAVTLYSKNIFFDWATQYVREHKTLTSPAGAFSLSDAEFDKFAAWAVTRNFSYRSNSEEMLDSLKAEATREKLYDAAKPEFTALQAKLTKDKKADLAKNRTEVKRLLEGEIVSRYYYQRGRIVQKLASDPELAKAVTYLENPTQYGAVLTAKK
jgi:carboxyl-terminal processing protease